MIIVGSAPRACQSRPGSELGDQAHRHYGLLANATRVQNLARARELLAAPLSPLIAAPERSDEHPAQQVLPTANLHPCPCCGASLVIIETFTRAHAPRAPPLLQEDAA